MEILEVNIDLYMIYKNFFFKFLLGKTIFIYLFIYDTYCQLHDNNWTHVLQSKVYAYACGMSKA